MLRKALGQCNDFLTANLPQATRNKTPSTAAAAELILTDPYRQDSAAICSSVCTTVFPGLEVLQKGIQKEKGKLMLVPVLRIGVEQCLTGSRQFHFLLGFGRCKFGHARPNNNEQGDNREAGRFAVFAAAIQDIELHAARDRGTIRLTGAKYR